MLRVGRTLVREVSNTNIMYIMDIPSILFAALQGSVNMYEADANDSGRDQRFPRFTSS